MTLHRFQIIFGHEGKCWCDTSGNNRSCSAAHVDVIESSYTDSQKELLKLDFLGNEELHQWLLLTLITSV